MSKVMGLPIKVASECNVSLCRTKCLTIICGNKDIFVHLILYKSITLNLKQQHLGLFFFSHIRICLYSTSNKRNFFPFCKP